MAGDYTVPQIKAILKVCKDSGVTQLQIGNFSATFSPPESKALEVITLTPEQQKEALEYQNEVFLEQEKRVREDELSNLRLSDPEAYEDLVNRGELIDAGQESNGIES